MEQPSWSVSLGGECTQNIPNKINKKNTSPSANERLTLRTNPNKIQPHNIYIYTHHPAVTGDFHPELKHVHCQGATEAGLLQLFVQQMLG